MEDKDLKELFSDFRPNMAPDPNFMAKLQQSLDRVELVKQHNKALQRRNRIAAVIAAMTGFITGALFILLLPYTTPAVESLSANLSVTLPELNSVDLGYMLRFSIAILMSAVSAFGVYELCTTQLNGGKTII